jgi:hypothetical protein
MGASAKYEGDALRLTPIDGVRQQWRASPLRSKVRNDQMVQPRSKEGEADAGRMIDLASLVRSINDAVKEDAHLMFSPAEFVSDSWWPPEMLDQSLKIAPPLLRTLAGMAALLCIAAGEAPPRSNSAATTPPMIAELNRIANALERPQPDETAEQRDRANRDLAAQEAQARWALWMVWIGIFSIILSVLGVLLIWRTLKATQATVREAEKATEAAQATVREAEKSTEAAREAAKAAQNVAQSQTRAYAKITNLSLTVERDQGRLWVAQVEIEIMNFGQTPAFNLENEISVTLRRFGRTMHSQLCLLDGPPVNDLASAAKLTQVWRSDPVLHVGTYTAIEEFSIEANVELSVLYDDVFEQRQTKCEQHVGPLKADGYDGQHVARMRADLQRVRQRAGIEAQPSAASQPHGPAPAAAA